MSAEIVRLRPVSLEDLRHRPPDSVAFFDFARGGFVQERAWKLPDGRHLTVTASAETRRSPTLRHYRLGDVYCATLENAIAFANGDQAPIPPSRSPPFGPRVQREFKFTARELAKGAKAEARHRRRVYQRFVDEAREGWTVERLERGVALMLEIAGHFDAIADAEEGEETAAEKAERPELPL